MNAIDDQYEDYLDREDREANTLQVLRSATEKLGADAVARTARAFGIYAAGDDHRLIAGGAVSKGLDRRLRTMLREQAESV